MLCGSAVAAVVAAGAGDPPVGGVQLSLAIPPAGTYVLGDPIPLLWRFSNQSTQALGFMWEGCCRLNGKLEVSAVDRSFPTAPPGQALAHMFARADRLEPGVPKEYDTKVSDWVRLPGTGAYEFRGTYRGVLPGQFPQVQRGLALWRDAAQSASIRLNVLGVEDYLAQREDRASRRGLRVTLAGASSLVPLGTNLFQVAFENLTDQPQSFDWPDAASLWVLDDAHERVVPAAVLTGSTVPVRVPARGKATVGFALGSDRFEGEAFADYRLFIDLAEAGPDRPRVPSAPIGLRWRLDHSQVVSLVRDAARGAGTGARNAPLKLLRLHLAEIGSDLEALESGEAVPEARALARRLALAARLRPLQPRPGLAELRLGVEGDPSRPVRWISPVVQTAFAKAGSAAGFREQFADIVGVRRHLGWEIEVGLEPAVGADPAVGDFFVVAEALEPQAAELAGPVSVLAPLGGTNGMARLRLARGLAPVPGPSVRVGERASAWSADGRTWQTVPGNAEDGSAAIVKAAAGGGASPAWVVLAERGVRWSAVRSAMGRWLESGVRVELRLAEE